MKIGLRVSSVVSVSEDDKDRSVIRTYEEVFRVEDSVHTVVASLNVAEREFVIFNLAGAQPTVGFRP